MYMCTQADVTFVLVIFTRHSVIPVLVYLTGSLNSVYSECFQKLKILGPRGPTITGNITRRHGKLRAPLASLELGCQSIRGNAGTGLLGGRRAPRSSNYGVFNIRWGVGALSYRGHRK